MEQIADMSLESSDQPEASSPANVGQSGHDNPGLQEQGDDEELAEEGLLESYSVILWNYLTALLVRRLGDS